MHSHADHWFGVLEMAKHMGAKDVYLHCIMDGRDTDPHLSLIHISAKACAKPRPLFVVSFGFA